MTSPRAAYQLVVYDTTGRQRDVLDMRRVENLQYSRVLNDVGRISFALGNPLDPILAVLSQTDTLVDVYRRNNPRENFQREGTYFIRYYNRFLDEIGNEHALFAGVSLEHLLSRRRIVADNDPLSGFSNATTKQGLADVVMASFVTDQCIAPASYLSFAFSGLSVSPTVGQGGLVFERVEGISEETLLEVLQRLAIPSGMDFRIVRGTGASFVFEANFIGTNRTVSNNYPSSPFLMFDPRRGNLYEPNFSIDRREERTFVFVLGQGPEYDRTVVPYTTADAADSPWNLIVTTANNNQAETVDEIIATGTQVLQEEGKQSEFTFQIDTSTYNQDWFLGDRVTASWDEIQQDVRITSVEITLEDNQELIRVETSNRYNAII